MGVKNVLRDAHAHLAVGLSAFALLAWALVAADDSYESRYHPQGYAHSMSLDRSWVVELDVDQRNFMDPGTTVYLVRPGRDHRKIEVGCTNGEIEFINNVIVTGNGVAVLQGHQGDYVVTWDEATGAPTSTLLECSKFPYI